MRPSISVVPWPDESIPSMIWRLQAFTGRTTASFRLKSYRKLYDDPDGDVLGFLGKKLGVDAATMVRHTLRGHLGDAYAQLGWRDHRLAGQWGCGTCGFQTIWCRLVLVTCCPACGRLLSDDGVARAPAPSAARDLQLTYLDGLRSCRLADDARVERFWRLLSFHLCTGWSTGDDRLASMPVGTGLGKPRDLTWRNPDWIARFATVAWPASATTKAFREHIKRVTVATLLDEPTRHGVDDVDEERALLHRQIRGASLEERNVPDHLLEGRSPLGGCHLEAIGYAVSRALRREVVLARRGHRLTKEELIAGRGQLRQTREIAAVNELLAHEADGLRILRHLAAGLGAAEPGARIDYQERRATLATVHTVPAHLLRRLSPPVRDRKVPARVRANPLGRDAAAWIWVELAGGVLHHSPHHAATRNRLRAFDRTLLPEDRLLLLEHGYNVLGAVADDVARQHQPAAAAATDGEDQADAG